MSDFDDILLDLEEEEAAIGANETVDPSTVMSSPDAVGALAAAGQPAPAAEDHTGAWLGALFKPSYLSGHTNLRAPQPGDLEAMPTEFAGGANAAAAGAVHGTTMGLERSMPEWAGGDAVRNWSVEAEENHPTAFLGGDIASNLNPYSPLNKIPGLSSAIKGEGLMRGAGRVGADVLQQVATDAVDTATRKWSDSTNPEYDWIDALRENSPVESGLTVAASLPGALLGNAAAGSHYRQTRPEQQQLRKIEYQDARYRSAGLDPTKVKQLPPEKQAEILAQIEMLTTNGQEASLLNAPTVKQLNLRAHQAAGMAHDEKSAALAALAAQGAEVNPDVIASNVRRDLQPGSGPAVQAHNLATDRAAQAYNDMPRELVPLPPAPPVPPSVAPPLPPTAAAQGLPPPPLPAGPPPVAAPPPPAAAPAPRVSARAPAMQAAPPARPSARALPRQVLNVDNANIDPSTVPPDPIGALAAARSPDQLDAAMLDATNAWHDQNAAQWQADAPPPAAPDDMALLMEQEMIPQMEASPGAMNPDELIELEMAGGLERSGNPGQDPYTRRPAARALPEPQYLPPTPSARYQPPYGPAQQQQLSPSDQYHYDLAMGVERMDPPPSATPQLPQAAGQMPPQMAGPQPAAVGSPPLPPTHGPMQGPLAQRGMTVPEFEAERSLVGGDVDLLKTSAENARTQARYAALMDAARQGFGRTDPSLMNQWDKANADEGILRIIADEGQRAADNSNPHWISALGGLGSAASVGAHALGSVGLPTAAGLGAGVAAGRWALPRAHALRANWLSIDTASMMDRISGYGQKPVGSIMSGASDARREPPPPPAAESGEPDNGETSALSPGEFLGRDTTNAMLGNPQMFMAYADDYSKAGTDDRRAAVTERLYRTDPQFARDVFPSIQGGEIA